MAWVTRVNLKGSKGDKGDPGAAGIAPVAGPWILCPANSVNGWAHAAASVYARLNGNNVELKGFGVNAPFTGGFQHAFTIPAGLPAPSSTHVFPVGGNAPAHRACEINPAREIKFYTSGATAAYYSVAGMFYGTV